MLRSVQPTSLIVRNQPGISHGTCPRVTMTTCRDERTRQPPHSDRQSGHHCCRCDNVHFHHLQQRRNAPPRKIQTNNRGRKPRGNSQKTRHAGAGLTFLYSCSCSCRVAYPYPCPLHGFYPCPCLADPYPCVCRAVRGRGPGHRPMEGCHRSGLKGAYCCIRWGVWISTAVLTTLVCVESIPALRGSTTKKRGQYAPTPSR